MSTLILELSGVALYVNNNNVTYFVEHIPKEIKVFIYCPFRIQAYDSIMYGYFCTGFYA